VEEADHRADHQRQYGQVQPPPSTLDSPLCASAASPIEIP